MKPEIKPDAPLPTGNIDLLPRRHRVAHLRALLRQLAAGSPRREQLAPLLRDQLTALASTATGET
jgi:hypothetical protein